MESQPVQVSANPLRDVSNDHSEEELHGDGVLDRTRSNVPVSTHVYESCAISASVGDVWSALRSMDFAFSELISGGELVSGHCVNEVGSVHKLHFHDGTDWTIQIQELSDLTRTLVFELLERTDGVRVSSCMHSIKLARITQLDQTFVEWTVDFSNDADAQICQDSRFKRQAELISMQEYFQRPRCAAKKPSSGEAVDASNLSAEEFARYDTNEDGVIDANEMAAFLSDIQGANFKLTKVAKQPSSYAYGDVKAELKAGNFKLRKVEEQDSILSPGTPLVKAEPAEEQEEGVRGSSTHVDLNNLKDSGSGDLSAEEFAALRAKTKSAAEVAKNMTPEQQAAYGCKPGIAASAVRADSDGSDDEGADFQMGAEGQGTLLADY